MQVDGVGIISTCGRGVDLHRKALSDPLLLQDGEQCICRVAPENLKDRAVLKNMRRADRFSRMAVLAAHDALADAGIDCKDDGQDLGIIVTTAFGPHGTTFQFLDTVLDFGDALASPIKFAHSVHNAAASYIVTALGILGPVATLTKFETPLYEGFLLASAWLREGRCRYVLVGYVEECSEPLNDINTSMARKGEKGSLQPFNLSPHSRPLFTEGSIFLALSTSSESLVSLKPEMFTGKDKIADLCTFFDRFRPVGRTTLNKDDVERNKR
ncbi:beta-ketoacyl synthase N-terminal-like domain-containing protein [Thermodesulfobacteriota bacterium]